MTASSENNEFSEQVIKLIYCCWLLLTSVIKFCSSILPYSKRIEKPLPLREKTRQTIPSTESLKLPFMEKNIFLET